ncbi:MAG: C-type lectin domain-containing protein [bacterium]
MWNDNNNNGKYEQNWSGLSWAPVINSSEYSVEPGTCKYKCAATHHRENSECVSNTKPNQNCSPIPLNAEYNTVTKITQTWNSSASKWEPTTESIYSETESTEKCHFKCKYNYEWDATSCNSKKRYEQPCTGLQPNTVWNTATSITQTWDGTTWMPSTVGSYSEEQSSTECRYRCADGYHREGNSCVISTRTASCGSKPEPGTVWNDGGKNGSYTQTWSGGSWKPNLSASYSTAIGDCHYICSSSYHYENGNCVSNNRTFTCANKPTGTEWNSVGSYPQTWNGSSWQPPDSITHYNTISSDTECRYICALNYTWTGIVCKADTKEYLCNPKPQNDETVYNSVDRYTQAWTGSAWNPADDPVTEYNTTASTSSCRYKCNTNYNWNGSQCVAATKTFTCTGKPANSVWNIVGSYTQTWSGSSWQPPESTATYNDEPSSTECRYKCSTNFHWTGSTCVQCIDNGHCGGATPYCFNNSCVECLNDTHCTTPEYTCQSNQCRPFNPCGDGWDYNHSTGRCYKYVSTSATWINAKSACESQGGRLVDFSDATENQYVAGLIPNNSHIWIGLNDFPTDISSQNPTTSNPQIVDGSTGGVFIGNTSGGENKTTGNCGSSGSLSVGKENWFKITAEAGKGGNWRIIADQATSEQYDLALVEYRHPLGIIDQCADTPGNCASEQLYSELTPDNYKFFGVDSTFNSSGKYVIEFVPPATVLPSGITRAFTWAGGATAWDQSSFTNFVSGEPNFNSAARGACTNEFTKIRCVGAEKKAGASNGAGWYDDDCNIVKPYVCEK